MACAIVVPAAAYADMPEVVFGQESGCMEGPMKQFGKYIGDWNISDSSLQSDGSTWKAGTGDEGESWTEVYHRISANRNTPR